MQHCRTLEFLYLGAGGGGYIPCPNQETGAIGTPPTTPLTLPIWGSFAANVFSYASSQSPLMKIESSGYGGENATITTAWADAIAQNSVPYGAGFGAESLALHDAVLYSEGLPCSNDWCEIFNQYYGTVPILGLQTIGLSNPSCTTDPGFSLTCSLVYVLPFGTQRHANVFEVGNEDLLCAYYSGYSNVGNCNVTAPFQPYQAAVQNAAAGQPGSTSSAAGKASLSGKASSP